jgi:hypothetical protein
MTKTPGEFEPPKPITKAERDARKAFRQVDAENATGNQKGQVGVQAANLPLALNRARRRGSDLQAAH